MIDTEAAIRARTTTALADCRAYASTDPLKAFDGLLCAMGATYRYRLETVSEFDLKTTQALLRQVIVLRECLSGDNGELPLVG